MHTNEIENTCKYTEKTNTQAGYARDLILFAGTIISLFIEDFQAFQIIDSHFNLRFVFLLFGVVVSGMFFHF